MLAQLRSSLALFPLLITTVVTGCDGDSADGSAGADASADAQPTPDEGAGADASADAQPTPDEGAGAVVELAVRRLNDGQDVAEFETARDTFVGRLRSQEGVETDREFSAFFDFGAQAAPTAPVFIGMTQYASSDAFAAASAALGSSPEAASFFSTFTPEAFTALRPLNPSVAVDLAGIANQSGQVLEVAVRDLSTYEGFDQTAYDAARDAFLALLSQQTGFVAEYQWISVLDPNIAVGMTVYESQEAFFGVLGNESFVSDPATAAFLFGYPPATAYVSTVVR